MEIQEIRAEMQEQSRIAAKLNELRIQQQKLRETESMLRAIRSREKRDVEWLKQNCPEKAGDILDCETRIAGLRGQLKEITEALDAGKSAKQTTEAIKKSLKSAESWGT